MPAPISVIIPTFNAAQTLPGCLAALMVGLEFSVIRDLVVSDGGSDDDTCRIADAAGAEVVTGPRGRGGQLARGAAAAKGRWLLLLHADTYLAPGWPNACFDHINAHEDKVGYFQLAFRAHGTMPRIVARWANIRSDLFGLPYGDQGLLVSRETLAQAGGIPDMPLMEDVALARAFRGRLRRLDCTAHTSAERYLQEGWIRRGARNQITLTRYFLGADPKDLASSYRR
ncbi:MAG: TIGR04283 family arsenosugar biosynthesis glycosyltransferase [Pseudomonadota bacterium]